MSENQQNQQLPLSEWIPTDLGFTYQLFWPYEENTFNPDNTEVDVRVKDIRVNPDNPKYNGKTFIGTFITYKKLFQVFEESESQEDYANGTYIPLKDFSDSLMVKRISQPILSRTIEYLLANNSFKDFFIEEIEL